MTLKSVLVRSALVAALGGLLFGFDTAVIAGTTKSLRDTVSLRLFCKHAPRVSLA
jgi:hypothetical protein